MIVPSNGKDELNNIVEDPEETRNSIYVQKDIHKGLRAKIDSWLKENREDIKDEDTYVSAEIKKRLEALGYFT